MTKTDKVMPRWATQVLNRVAEIKKELDGYTHTLEKPSKRVMIRFAKWDDLLIQIQDIVQSEVTEPSARTLENAIEYAKSKPLKQGTYLALMVDKELKKIVAVKDIKPGDISDLNIVEEKVNIPMMQRLLEITPRKGDKLTRAVPKGITSIIYIDGKDGKQLITKAVKRKGDEE